jgi:hypothetical protein
MPVSKLVRTLVQFPVILRSSHDQLLLEEPVIGLIGPIISPTETMLYDSRQSVVFAYIRAIAVVMNDPAASVMLTVTPGIVASMVMFPTTIIS